MSAYRTLNQTVLAKVETTAGTDASPTVGSNAVLVENPQSTPNIESLETNEVTGALDDRGPLPGRGFRPFNFDVYLKGADTPGTAPEYGPLMQAVGFTEVLTAAAITGTASAGASSSITVESADYAALAIGMVIRTTGGTGGSPTQRRVISALPGSNVVTVNKSWTVTPDGTTTYSIDANALYTPNSDALKTISIYRYRHRSDGGNSKLDTCLGAVGNMSLAIPIGQPGKLSFSLQGGLSIPTDVTPPAAATYQAARAQPYLNASTTLAGVDIKPAQITLDLGNQVQLIGNPAQAFGYDAAGITRRRTSGRINPPSELQSTRDALTDLLAGTTRSFAVRWGSVAGNRVSIYIPQLLYSGEEEEDVNGFGHEGLPFRCLGQNTGVYISLF